MADPDQEVVLVRHGETAWSLSGQHTGLTDIPLTERGRAMARAVGRALVDRSFAAVLVSPLQRARETCALAGYGAQAEVMADLSEWHYGLYEGLTTADIHARDPQWSLWANGCPGGEIADQVGARADRVLARVHAVHGPVLVVAHGHILRVVAARWLALPPQDGRLFMLATATLSSLGHERDQPVLNSWNLPVFDTR